MVVTLPAVSMLLTFNAQFPLLLQCYGFPLCFCGIRVTNFASLLLLLSKWRFLSQPRIYYSTVRRIGVTVRTELETGELSNITRHGNKHKTLTRRTPAAGEQAVYNKQRAVDAFRNVTNNVRVELLTPGYANTGE